jgi:broad specificity phosphatase PhoE
MGVALEVRPTSGENDRTATGPVPPGEFEILANQFFREPARSVRGWERAVDAQARIGTALADLIHTDAPGDVAVVGHGGVGTLWYCQLLGLEIDRRYDQPKQGHYFRVDRVTARPTCAWLPIEALGAG